LQTGPEGEEKRKTKLTAAFRKPVLPPGKYKVPKMDKKKGLKNKLQKRVGQKILGVQNSGVEKKPLWPEKREAPKPSQSGERSPETSTNRGPRSAEKSGGGDGWGGADVAKREKSTIPDKNPGKQHR